MRGILIALLLACVQVSQAQPAPPLTAEWQGSALAVEWSGAPDGSCVYLDGVLLETPCGASGSVLLPRGGVDVRYVPRPGNRLELDINRSDQAVSASVVVPDFVVMLPLMAN